MTADYFAYKQYFDYVVYKELARIERNREFRASLEQLMAQELQDFEFWQARSVQKDFRVSPFRVWLFKSMRKVLGLTFTAKFLEGRERGMIDKYSKYLNSIADIKERKGIEEIIKHEQFHEKKFISQVKEEKVEFMSSIVLGINDGLIELTGALVGFSFALQNHKLVALTGLITGVSASLSMAASSYMQAKHEVGKDPRKAGLYTGISYIVVVIILVAPFLLMNNVFAAIGVMLALVLGIITALSFYASVLFDFDFKSHLGQMVLFSLGVAVIAFGIGYSFRSLSGVEV